MLFYLCPGVTARMMTKMSKRPKPTPPTRYINGRKSEKSGTEYSDVDARIVSASGRVKSVP